MSEQDQADLRLAFARLKQEAMVNVGCNPIQIQRMKKKKLAIKDRLMKLEDQIVPDIIA